MRFVALVVSCLVACRPASPSPDRPRDVDTRPVERERPAGHEVDPAVLSRFRAEYAAAKREPRGVFDRYLPVLGAAALLDHVEATYPACHAEAHDLGRALFAIDRSLETALRECGTRCTSGCMHGVVAEAFGSSTADTVLSQMRSFCTNGEMARRHKPGNCAHGIGHALMFVNQGDVGRSIDGCLGFPDEPMQYYCGTGVFMERFFGPARPAVASRSMHSPCDEETLFPAACYRYKGTELLKTLGDPRKVAAACLSLDDLHRRGCFHGLGYASMGRVSQNPRRISAVCGGGDRNDRVACIEGLIEKLADFQEGRARAACAFLSSDLGSVCRQTVERKMYALDKPTFSLYYDEAAIAGRRATLAEQGPAAHQPAGHH